MPGSGMPGSGNARGGQELPDRPRPPPTAPTAPDRRMCNVFVVVCVERLEKHGKGNKRNGGVWREQTVFAALLVQFRKSAFTYGPRRCAWSNESLPFAHICAGCGLLLVLEIVYHSRRCVFENSAVQVFVGQIKLVRGFLQRHKVTSRSELHVLGRRRHVKCL